MKAFGELLQKIPFRKKGQTGQKNTELTETMDDEKAADDNIKAKVTAVSIALVMTVLASMGAEPARVKYLERYSGSLADLTAVSDAFIAWDKDVGDVRKLMEEAGIGTSSIYDPDAEVKLKVPFYSQKDYPTGCELVSTSMLLAKYGIKLTAEEIVTKGYIKTKKVYLDSREDPYGPDPHMTFVGDPLDDSGYGCYSGAIVKALKKILPKERYEVVDLTGSDLSDICYEYVDKGIPVLYWGSLQMEPLYYDTVNHWYIDEGKRKGEEFRWVSNEHCMVLIGHNRDNYIFNDPSVDKAGAEYIRPLVEKRFKELGNQAVAIVPVDKTDS